MKPQPPADLWERLAQAELAASGVVPPDAFTATEYADRHGIPYDTAQIRLKRLSSKGVLETGKCGGKRWYRVR